MSSPSLRFWQEIIDIKQGSLPVSRSLQVGVSKVIFKATFQGRPLNNTRGLAVNRRGLHICSDFGHLNDSWIVPLDGTRKPGVAIMSHYEDKLYPRDLAKGFACTFGGDLRAPLLGTLKDSAMKGGTP